MRAIIAVSLAFFSLANAAWSAPANKFQRPRPDPLPAPTVVRSNLPTAEAGVKKMALSHKIGVHSEKTDDGQDLNAVESDAMVAHSKSDGPGNAKSLILLRYEVGDDRVVDALIAAKNAGFEQVLLVTDFNVAMDGEFKDNEASNVDYDKAKLLDNDRARALKKLLANGFSINGKKYGIYSIPLYNRHGDHEAPIMHEKETFLLSRKVVGAAELSSMAFLTGTNNMTPAPRFNRLLTIADDDLSRYALDHALALTKVLSEGKPISEIAPRPPLRVVYGDGSFAEMAFTDAHSNVNDRIADLFTRAAGNPSATKIKGVWFNENVVTSAFVLNAMNKAMKAQTDFKVFGMVDGWNMDIHGQEMTATMAGYLVSRPFGKDVLGWQNSIRSRTEIYAYMRAREGMMDQTLEGAPMARHLDHDKTMAVLVNEEGRDWLYVFTGSFNASTHFENAEMQLMYRLPAESTLAKDFVSSVEKLVSSEPEYALPLELAIFRKFIGRLTGRSELEVDLDQTKRLSEEFQKGDHDKALSELRELAAKPTNLNAKTDAKTLTERLDRLSGFIKWSDPQSRGLWLRKLVQGGFGLAYPKARPDQIRGQLREVIFDRKIPDDELTRKTDEGLKSTGYSEEFIAHSKEPPPQPGRGPNATDAEPNAIDDGPRRGPTLGAYTGRLVDDNLILNCQDGLTGLTNPPNIK